MQQRKVCFVESLKIAPFEKEELYVLMMIFDGFSEMMKFRESKSAISDEENISFREQLDALKQEKCGLFYICQKIISGYRDFSEGWVPEFACCQCPMMTGDIAGSEAAQNFIERFKMLAVNFETRLMDFAQKTKIVDGLVMQKAPEKPIGVGKAVKAEKRHKKPVSAPVKRKIKGKSPKKSQPIKIGFEIHMDGEAVSLPFDGTMEGAIKKAKYVAKSVVATFEVVEFTPDNQEGVVCYSTEKDS